MAQHVCTLAFLPGLMETRLDLSHSEMDGDDTSGTWAAFQVYPNKSHHNFNPHTWVPDMPSLSLHEKTPFPPAAVSCVCHTLSSGGKDKLRFPAGGKDKLIYICFYIWG